MSKSLKRVSAALHAAGADAEILEMTGETRTAAQAAAQAGCAVDQIAKSIIFRGQASGKCVLFITAGNNQVDPVAAASVAGEALTRADAAFVREKTGFAIGGVAPLAHKTAPVGFFDPHLLTFETIYAAAGTPRHIFSVKPQLLLALAKANLADFVTSPSEKP